jgi:chitin synthase
MNLVSRPAFQVYSLAHFFEVYQTKHSLIRKAAFTVQAFFNAINLVRFFLAAHRTYVDSDIPTVVLMVQLGQFLHLLCVYQYTTYHNWNAYQALSFQVILTASLEDPSFGIPNIKYLNVIMQYGYLGIVVACFLFSMGNRPQG